MSKEGAFWSKELEPMSIHKEAELWKEKHGKGSWLVNVARLIQGDAFSQTEITDHHLHELAILLQVGKFQDFPAGIFRKKLPLLEGGAQGHLAIRHLIRRFATDLRKGRPQVDERHLTTATVIMAYVNSL